MKKITTLVFVFLLTILCEIDTVYANTKKVLYTKEGDRLKLVSSKPGKNFNIIFIPGGPGMDSAYLKDLALSLQVPGNIWLLDLAIMEAILGSLIDLQTGQNIY